MIFFPVSFVRLPLPSPFYLAPFSRYPRNKTREGVRSGIDGRHFSISKAEP